MKVHRFTGSSPTAPFLHCLVTVIREETPVGMALTALAIVVTPGPKTMTHQKLVEVQHRTCRPPADGSAQGGPRHV